MSSVRGKGFKDKKRELGRTRYINTFDKFTPTRTLSMRTHVRMMKKHMIVQRNEVLYVHEV